MANRQMSNTDNTKSPNYTLQLDQRAHAAELCNTRIAKTNKKMNAQVLGMASINAPTMYIKKTSQLNAVNMISQELTIVRLW